LRDKITAVQKTALNSVMQGVIRKFRLTHPHGPDHQMMGPHSSSGDEMGGVGDANARLSSHSMWSRARESVLSSSKNTVVESGIEEAPDDSEKPATRQSYRPVKTDFEWKLAGNWTVEEKASAYYNSMAIAYYFTVLRRFIASLSGFGGPIMLAIVTFLIDKLELDKSVVVFFKFEKFYIKFGINKLIKIEKKLLK